MITFLHNLDVNYNVKKSGSVKSSLGDLGSTGY
jgi:hypothetical protein